MTSSLSFIRRPLGLAAWWEIPILLATVTGARRSEVLGISWEDVDLKNGNVFIRRGVDRT